MTSYDAAILDQIASTPEGLTLNRLSALMALMHLPCREGKLRLSLRRLLKAGAICCWQDEPAPHRGRPPMLYGLPAVQHSLATAEALPVDRLRLGALTPDP
jgi:hypothetical protein